MASASVLFMLGAPIVQGVSVLARVSGMHGMKHCRAHPVTLACPMQEVYAQIWSEVTEESFSGGSFKYSNIDNFPGSTTMSANLTKLEVGGIRGLHWHKEAEWAFVLSGVCR